MVIQDLASGQNFTDWCDILINAGGILNAWRWPAIPGLEKYKGKLLHTANWDRSVDLTGKHVGLIGNGYVLAVLQHVQQLIVTVRPVFKFYRPYSHTWKK